MAKAQRTIASFVGAKGEVRAHGVDDLIRQLPQSSGLSRRSVLDGVRELRNSGRVRVRTRDGVTTLTNRSL